MEAENRTWYYARVSSKRQNIERQVERFKEIGATDREIICDKQSGKDFNRQGYMALKNALLRKGDTLVVTALDRLGRNKLEIKKELEWMKEQHIHIKILDVPTTLITVPEGQEWIIEVVNNILVEVMASLAEHERIHILEQQREGIEIAKRAGKYKGRKPIEIDDFENYYKDWKTRKLSKIELSKLLGISRPTLDRLIKQYECKIGSIIGEK